MLALAFLLGAFGSHLPAADRRDDRSASPAARFAAPDEDDARRQPAATPAPRSRPAEADEDDEEEGRVQPSSAIVVTARRLDAARTAIDAALGATVYTLTNDTVENRPGGETGSLTEILSQAPGATLSGNALVVRGSRQAQVRINDVIVPEAISDPAEHLSARLAEATRLITGTLPAQFGFAPGGVISVKTKSGLYQHGGQAELFAGSRGAIEPALEYAGSAEGTSLFASGSLERDRSMLSDPAGIEATDRRRAVEGLAFADHVIDAENRVSLILGGSRERHRIGATALGPGRERQGDGYAVGTFQHSDDGFTIQASLFGGLSSNRATFASTSRERRSSLGTQVDAAETLGGGHTIRFGLLASRSRARERDLAGAPVGAGRTAAAAYVQDEWKVAPSLILNPGLRVEWLRGFGSGPALEPRASLVWSADEDLTAHAGYARYASAPPLGDSGAAGLRDETDDYYDAGLQRKLGPLTLGIDAYWREARNFLAERETPGTAVTEAFAFREARVRGIELSATYAHRGTSAWANLAVGEAGGRSIVGGRGLFPPATTAATAARRTPLAGERPLTASAGLTRRFGDLTLSGDIVASSGAVRTVDAARPNAARDPVFALVSLAAVYHAKLAGRPADLRIDLTNLTDVRQATSDARNLEGGWTRPTSGRTIMLGIEQGF
jgi:hypothetical protein